MWEANATMNFTTRATLNFLDGIKMTEATINKDGKILHECKEEWPGMSV